MIQNYLLRKPKFYECMHAVFSDVKNEYLLRHLSGYRVAEKIRVIDLGCGPGTNAHLFIDPGRYEYLGIDNNPGYIKQARKKFPLEFRCADIVDALEDPARYDIVLINSVIHHIDESTARLVFQAAAGLLTPEGECLVLDMVHPDVRKPANLLQRALISLDRGTYCRSFGQLQKEIGSFFNIQKVYDFSISPGALLLWDLRLLVCRPR
ncbi:MAG: class I SAM-dependent methyltransferase [Pseudomonadota bacterium]